jgi:hypothetical protein
MALGLELLLTPQPAVSGQGPYYGQAVWFTKYHPEAVQSARERYYSAYPHARIGSRAILTLTRRNQARDQRPRRPPQDAKKGSRWTLVGRRQVLICRLVVCPVAERVRYVHERHG